MSGRGVSEVLGFVLVFAVVTGMIGVVYATGISGLDNAQQSEKFTNVERAFDVLADNVADIHRGGAPSRATEVKLGGGSLSVNQTVTFRIRAENSSDPLDNASWTVNPEAIVYEDNDGASLVYVGGAVMRAESGGAVMLHEPGWVIGPNRSVIPLVNTYGSDASGIGGSGKVLIVAERGTRQLQAPFSVGEGHTAIVNVTVTSPRVGAWKSHMKKDDRFSAVDSDTNHNNVTYQLETKTVYVPKTGIEVTFNR